MKMIIPVVSPTNHENANNYREVYDLVTELRNELKWYLT